VTSAEITLEDGRTLRAYDSGGDGSVIVWHHGTPQTGALIAPLLEAAANRSIRMVSYARPSYGGSTPNPGRDVASAASDTEQVADAFGVERFAVMGASGGGPHALACAALLGDRVSRAATLASLAPFTDDFDWFEGMAAPQALRAARDGREARAALPQEFDPDTFTDRDWAVLEGRWKALGEDAGKAGAAGPEGAIDDDLAFAMPWGFELERVVAPVLLAHGGEDRVVPLSHAHFILDRLPNAELWLRPRDGHVSILDAVPIAMDWLRDR
jgi:pimeloyl-ACP methyl ester carboxylesterase